MLGSELVMRRWRIAVAGLLFCYGMGVGVTKVVFPYKTWEDADHRDFSRRLWRSDSPDEPLLEVSKDLGVHLYSHFGSLNGHIYRDFYGTRPTVSPNAPIAERLAAVPPGKTIRCVAIHRPGEMLDSSAYAAWLSAMSRQYGLVNEETHELLYDEYHLSYCYRIWRFEAKSPDAHPLTALQPEATLVR